MCRKVTTKQKGTSRLKEKAIARMEQKMYMRYRVCKDRVKREQLN
jgi:hypothetical protein